MIMLWQEYIPYIFSFLFWPKTISMMLISATNEIPFSWESKSIPKIMCSQKYGDLYVISYLLPTMILCNSHFSNFDFHSIWKTTLVGNILPHIFLFIKPFENY